MMRWASNLFFLTAVVGLAAAFHQRGLNDPGTLWHTRVGNLILESGFMTTDPFTFTFEGKTWIPQQWLGEVLMAGLHRVGGFDAMLWFFICAFAWGFTLVFRRLIHAGMGWPLAGLVVAMAMVAAGFHFYVRPHVFTIIYSIIVTLLLIDFDNRRCSWKKLLWLIPLFIIWTNIHGGMLGGIATMMLAASGWGLEWFFTSPQRKQGRDNSPLLALRAGQAIVILAAIIFACALTMFINPIGFELQRTWFRLIGSKTLAEFIPEHSPLNLARGGDQAVVVFAALYFVLLAGAGRPKMLWLVPLAWLVLTITSIRNGPIFVAVAAPMIADLWPHTSYYRWFRAGGDTLATAVTPLGRLPWVVPLAITVGGLWLPPWTSFDSKYVPTDMTDTVRNIPAGERIYNDPNFGGFLIWNAPNCKIFMDDRFELCGDEWLRQFVEDPRFDDWQRQYAFRYAFVGIGALDNHPRWELVKQGTIASLYKLR